MSDWCSERSARAAEALVLLELMNQHGQVLWVNEPKLRDVLVFDPIIFLVK